MTWTTKILKKVYNVGQDKIEIEVEFTDGVDTLSNTYYVKNLNELRSRVKLRIIELETLQSTSDGLSIGNFDSTDPTPDVAELARRDYSKNIIDYRNTNIAIEMGMLNGSAIDSIKTKLKDDYDESYLKML